MCTQTEERDRSLKLVGMGDLLMGPKKFEYGSLSLVVQLLKLIGTVQTEDFFLAGEVP